MPGGLKVKRRARRCTTSCRRNGSSNRPNPLLANDWLSIYAMAVNEENAAGGRWSPRRPMARPASSRRSCAISRSLSPGRTRAGIRDFLLAAAAIGGIIKHNASISGAEVGCQGEVGSASAMAAAGLCAVMGGTPSRWRTPPRSRWNIISA
jgi:L-serine dehydratase